MKAIPRSTGKPRITERSLREFIVDVVNIAAGEDSANDDGLYLFTQYPKFFPTREVDAASLVPFLQRKGTTLEGLQVEAPIIYHRALRRVLREGLREVWQAEDENTADWQIFQLQSRLYHMMDNLEADETKRLQPPPLHAPIHQALHWVRRHRSKLRSCGNPECMHPYFVAEGKQRFCSTLCADNVQKMHKRRWWEERGSEWRSARKTKKEKKDT